MEYLSFGLLLERCRFFFVPELASCRRALVLGDGDGRFLARLLAAAPALHAHAVDASPAMLRRLCALATCLDAAARLTTICADIRAFTPPARGAGEKYDLVATHFFLDCFTAQETGALVSRLLPHLAPGALWVVSEFEVPVAGPFRAALGRITIAGLYAAFRLLTGLRVRHIPPWRDSLARAGFVPRASRSWLGGLLVCEIWQLLEATARQSPRSPAFDPGPEPAPGIPPPPEPIPTPGPPPEPRPPSVSRSHPRTPPGYPKHTLIVTGCKINIRRCFRLLQSG